MWSKNMFILILFWCTIFLLKMSMMLHPSKLVQETIEEDGITSFNEGHPMTKFDISKEQHGCINYESVKDKIKYIASSIYKAKLHVRGLKTSDFLKQAIETMDSLLFEVNINPQSIYNRTNIEPVHVCPEKYMRARSSALFSYKGFEVTNCEHNVPICKLVTVIKIANTAKENIHTVKEEIIRFVASIFKTHNNISIVISTNDKNLASTVKNMYPMVTLMDNKGLSDGKSLNEMIKEVKTPFVFVTRNAQFLTNDSRFERLVRAMDSLEVKVAGGAFRNPEGHWRKGCFQSVYRNFTLEYLEGYDESKHECLFCDFIEGPFIAAKDSIEKNRFEDLPFNDGLFEDWFMRLSIKGVETIVCPDSMFHILNHITYKHTRLMEKWNLFKIVSSQGITTVRERPEIEVDKMRSKTRSTNSLQSLTHAIKTIMNVLESANIYCEVFAGTLLGAVKLDKVLPWEWDADIMCLTANISAIGELRKTFAEKGFSFRKFKGYFSFPYRGWEIEIFGNEILDSELMVLDGMKPTKVLLNGQWVCAPRNPGLHARNWYGREIYRHAEHWRHLNFKNESFPYTTNVFTPCSNKSSHDCLDRYNADGNLQFNIMLP